MDPTLSFFMALAALMLTAVNIAVTVVNFNKSAGRVVVEMNAALLNPARALVANDQGTWGLRLLNYPSTGVELVKVVIENPGRTAATITKLDFRVEGSTDADFAMGVKPIAVKNLSRTLGGTSSENDLPRRLEPYDQVVYLLDFWAVANQVFAEEPRLRQINMWVSVKVAGQSQPYDSKKHGYWTVRREWISFIPPYTKRTAQSLILTSLIALFEEPGQNPYLVDLAKKVEERISSKSSSLEITSALQEILGPGGEFDGDLIGPYNIWGIISFGFDVKNQLDAFGENVTWAPALDAAK